jgi:hypothetical protein
VRWPPTAHGIVIYPAKPYKKYNSGGFDIFCPQFSIKYVCRKFLKFPAANDCVRWWLYTELCPVKRRLLGFVVSLTSVRFIRCYTDYALTL